MCFIIVLNINSYIRYTGRYIFLDDLLIWDKSLILTHIVISLIYSLLSSYPMWKPPFRYEPNIWYIELCVSWKMIMKKEYGSGSNTNNKKNALSSLTINKKKREGVKSKDLPWFSHTKCWFHLRLTLWPR